MAGRNSIIIELGEKNIKVCRAHRRGKKRIVNYTESFEFSASFTPQELRDVVSRFIHARYERVVISLPRSFFLMRFLKIPSQDPAEIKNMVPFQLAKLVPYPLEEVIYDFSSLDMAEGYSKVILFLVQKKKIAFLTEFLSENKIVPHNISISSLGVYEWLLRRREFAKVDFSRPAIIIDVDRYDGDFLVIHNQKLIFSRSFSSQEDGNITAGIQQSLRIFEKEFGKQEFSQVFVTGNKQEVALKSIGNAEVIFIDQWDDSCITQNVKKRAQEGYSFVSLLGLAVMPRLPQLDFSPPPLIQKRCDMQKRKRYFDLSIIIIEVVLIAGLLLFKYFFDKYTYARFLDNELALIKAEASQLDNAAGKLQVLQKQVQQNAPFYRVLYHLMSSIPQNIQLTLIDFQKNGEFTLKGYAQNMAEAFTIVAALNQSQFFTAVNAKHASKVKIENTEMIEFYIYGKRVQ